MKINSIIDLVKDLDTSRQTKNLDKLLIRILLHLQVEFSYKIPLCSVFYKNNAPCVWILKEDSTIEKRIISIDNHFSGETVTVKKGLDGTEKIIRAGVNALQDREKVIVIAQPEKSNVGGLI